tara:strand:- start:21813 stop:22013 length:201 start_codon:yes stop_codon:yes gene_type:complete
LGGCGDGVGAQLVIRERLAKVWRPPGFFELFCDLDLLGCRAALRQQDSPPTSMNRQRTGKFTAAQL